VRAEVGRAATALTAELEPAYRIDPQTHLLVEDAGFACFVGAAAAAIPLVVAVSMRPSLPRWFALAGVPVAVALGLSYFYFPFFVFLAGGSRRSAVTAARGVTT